jgi:flagellar biosynthesis chaperone FliJ
MRMARDPLAVLARLRRLETETARRRLGEAYGRLAGAEARAAEAGAALTRQGTLGLPTDYGTWLTRGLAERDRADRARGFAEATAAAAAASLGEARAAERGLELLREARAERAQQQARRRAQALLDEVGARPRHGRSPG